MVKCVLCDFSVDTGNEREDVFQMSKHWATHSFEEKQQYFAMFPQHEETLRPQYGWQNRLHRMENDMDRIEDTLSTAKQKMGVEERLLFTDRLNKLMRRLEKFKRNLEALGGKG
jgi:hypothetical protein